MSPVYLLAKGVSLIQWISGLISTVLGGGEGARGRNGNGR
jgi:hypothetical protein